MASDRPRRNNSVDLPLPFSIQNSSALQECVERVEAFEAPPQDFFVGQSFLCPTFQDTINPDRFHSLKSGVVQIGVMDHLPYLRYCFVRDRKTPDERLESAVVAMVRELGIKHVERDRARDSVCTWREYKFRLPVNELRDQPRRSNSVDLRARARQPCFALVLLRTEHRELSRTTAAFGATEQHRDIVSTCTVEEIDFANFTELSREAFQFRRRRFRIHFLAPPDETLKRFSQLAVIFGAGVIKHRDQLLFG